jgi:hypoxanthine phosphoribosyltransferase
MHKRFVTEQELILASFRLGVAILERDFRPTFIVGLWRGGSSVGISVQECLQTLGVQSDHISVRTSYEGRSGYEEGVRMKRPIKVHGTRHLVDHLQATDRLLIVDDVFASGRHSTAVIELLRERLRRNMPEDVRVAAPWFRPSAAGGPRPDVYLEETRDWLVLPYEISGLTRTEIAEHKPFLVPLLR